MVAKSYKGPERPTVYARVADNRLAHPLEETVELIESLVHPGHDLALKIEQQLLAAYAAGVSDGFAQGVAAEAVTNLDKGPK